MSRFVPRSSLDELRARRPIKPRRDCSRIHRIWLPGNPDDQPIYGRYLEQAFSNCRIAVMSPVLTCCAATARHCQSLMDDTRGTFGGRFYSFYEQPYLFEARRNNP